MELDAKTRRLERAVRTAQEKSQALAHTSVCPERQADHQLLIEIFDAIVRHGGQKLALLTRPPATNS